MNILTDHMGSDFDRLPELVKKAHYGATVMTGKVTVRRGGHIARFICGLFGFPKASESCQLVVRSNHAPDRIIWNRDFEGLSMSSEFYRDGEFLVERLGPFSLYFFAKEVSGKLCYDFKHTKMLGVPLPKLLSPLIHACESEESGQYQFSVLVEMPFAGKILEYFGVMSISTVQAHDNGFLEAKS